MKRKVEKLQLGVFTIILMLAQAVSAAPQAERVYLSGTEPDDAVLWEFFCSKGRKSGEWTKIPVPSNWEQHGFGNYNYGRDDEKHDETGLYRTTFFAPKEWEDRPVRLVFEGAMTQTEVKINGELIGPPNEGGYTPFRFNLNQNIIRNESDGKLRRRSKIRFGEENVLEVLVKKKPDNHSLDMGERWADYWVFGGIYRPVYLEIHPPAFVDRVAIDAQADGSFQIDVFPQVHLSIRTESGLPKPVVNEVQAQIQTLDGKAVGDPMSAPLYGSAGRIRLNTHISDPALWSSETPALYQVKVSLLNKGTSVFEKTERFGFRTVEVNPKSGIYLNGKKMLIRGMNRDMFDPQHARTISKERDWRDARDIKAMNVNLVRSHMPPSLEFMRACDELGMMVISELANWQAPVIDTPIAHKIVYEIVARYQNHPSVILWANGNEGGFNLEVDQFYHLYDLQNRTVIHPWTLFEGLLTAHYPGTERLLRRLAGENPYLPTEMMHGLYDGGHGAGLADHWKAIRNSPKGVGGVLWCWSDAAIARTDKDGKLDTSGNKSADGIVGPNNEREASYYTVREIWSPVQIPMKSLAADFTGVLLLENDYDFTSLENCIFAWKLSKFSDPLSAKTETTVLDSGSLKGPAIAPGDSGKLTLPLPENWKTADALELTATGANGIEIMRWAWPIGSPEAVAGDPATKPQSQSGNPFNVQLGNALWSFSPETGKLLGCSVGGKETGLGSGPVLYATGEAGPLEFSHAWKATASQDGDSVVIESKNASDASVFRWTLSPGGLVELSYSFAPIDAPLSSCAVGFDLPDETVASKRWLGAGPYRVWANRMQGPQYGLWENKYNDTVTGDAWDYPEFKGVFASIDWMRLDLRSGSTLLLDTDPGSNVGVLRPTNKQIPAGETDEHHGPMKAVWAYPDKGGLFLFHKIPAVGDKFNSPRELGPQSQPEVLSGPIRGRAIFYVRQAENRQ